MEKQLQTELIKEAQQWRKKPLGKEFEQAMAPHIERCVAAGMNRQAVEMVAIAAAALG